MGLGPLTHKYLSSFAYLAEFRFKEDQYLFLSQQIDPTYLHVDSDLLNGRGSQRKVILNICIFNTIIRSPSIFKRYYGYFILIGGSNWNDTNQLKFELAACILHVAPICACVSELEISTAKLLLQVTTEFWTGLLHPNLHVPRLKHMRVCRRTLVGTASASWPISLLWRQSLRVLMHNLGKFPRLDSIECYIPDTVHRSAELSKYHEFHEFTSTCFETLPIWFIMVHYFRWK